MSKFERNNGRLFIIRCSAAALSAACFGCCSKPKPDLTWTARPAVAWTQVATVGELPPPNARKMLASTPTVGLFPANLAVTRVAAENLPDGSANHAEPTLLADPRNEFLQWNSTLDDQMAVSEVFPVKQRDLGGGDAEPDQILAAFRALHARLGLIYAVNELSPNETEMFGMLYDTTNSKPVAALHARAKSTMPPGEERDCGRHEPYDVWDKDSRALVRAEFAKQMHASIRELILNDQPQMVDAPEGWKPEVSARPVAWPPRRKATP